MARSSINFVEVTAACEKLLSQGEKPTADKIHALLGKGTVTAIQKHLNHIFEQSRLDSASPEATSKTGAEAETTPTKPKITPLPDLLGDTAAEQTEVKPKTEAPESKTTPAHTEATKKSKDVTKERDGKRPNRRDRNNNRHQRIEFEEPPVETPLEQLSTEQLVAKIRQFESILLKEQMRREVAERITIETKDYADAIKEQVSQRINELKQNMDIVVEQLKTQLREQKQNFDQDLKYYQEQLAKANEALAKD